MIPRFCISIDDIRAAHARIREYIVRTPAKEFAEIDELVGATVFFKSENLQHVGAFKARGATNAVMSLDDHTAQRGVATHSSGNHAAALARAANLRGIPAHVVMPRNSRPIKLLAVRALGVEPILCEPTAEARQAAAERVVEETGATMIHPYDQSEIIAGQGTAALELTEQVERLDAVVVPVGGGGLLAGTLIAIKSIWPNTRVIAAEPAWADDAFRSWKSGKIEQPTRYDTVADGLRTPLGQYTFPIIREFVDDILLVEESEIEEATGLLKKLSGMVVEPSGAVSFAALRKYAKQFSGQRIGIVLSGGNMDVSDLGPPDGSDGAKTNTCS